MSRGVLFAAVSLTAAAALAADARLASPGLVRPSLRKPAVPSGRFSTTAAIDNQAFAVALRIGEVRLVPVLNAASVVCLDERVATATVSAEGLSVTGHMLGETYLLASVGSRTVVAAVRVEGGGAPAVTSRRDALDAGDRPLRGGLSTGGILKRAEFSVHYRELSSGSVALAGVRLTGAPGGVSYALSLKQPFLTSNPRFEAFRSLDARVTGPSFEARLGRLALVPGEEDFLPAGSLSAVTLRLTSTRLSLVADTRGPVVAGNLLFDPAGARVRLTWNIVSGLSLTGGAMALRSPVDEARVPFARADVELASVRLSARVAYVMPVTSAPPTLLVIGGLALKREGCEVGVSGGGQFLAPMSRAYGSYLNVAPLAVSAGLGCDGWPGSVSAAIGTAFGGVDDVLMVNAAATSTPMGPVRLRASAIAFPGDASRYPQVTGAVESVGLPVNLLLSSLNVLAPTYFAQDQLSVGVGDRVLTGQARLAINRSSGGPFGSNALVSLRLAPWSARLQFSAGAQASFDERLSWVGSQLSTQITLTPTPNYAITAGVRAIVGSNVTLLSNAGLSWRLGDDLPMDPLLAPLRSGTIVAAAFVDANGNARRDEGESPFAGAKLCLEGTCLVTGAAGEARFDGLTQSIHPVRLETTSVPGGITTGSSFRKVAVTGYTASRVDFGVRPSVRVHLRVLSDANGDHVAGPGDPEIPASARVSFETGVGAGVIAADAPGGSYLPLFAAGRVTAEVRGETLPPGYIPNGASVGHVVVDALDGSVKELVVAARPVRSVTGRVCFDGNANGRCEPTEVGVAGVSLVGADQVITTDAEGRFTFGQLAAGSLTLDVKEASLPGGLSPVIPASISIPITPFKRPEYDLPLQNKESLRRAARLLVDLPGRGSVVASVVAGAFISGAAMWDEVRQDPLATPDLARSLSKRDAADLDAVLKALSGRRRLLVVRAHVPGTLPDEEARAMGSLLTTAFGRAVVASQRLKPSVVNVVDRPLAAGSTRLDIRVLELEAEQ